MPFQKGHPSFLTEESKKKISQTLKGKIPKNFYDMQKKAWNMKRGVPLTGKRKIGWKLSDEARKKISQGSAKIWLGKNLSQKTKEKISKNLTGRYIGVKNPNWIKDRTKLKNYNQRQNSEYTQWRKRIFERDDYRCFDCGARGSIDGRKVYLNADHIYSFAKYPRLRYSIENGQTLCKECHLMKTIFERTGIYQNK